MAKAKCNTMSSKCIIAMMLGILVVVAIVGLVVKNADPIDKIISACFVVTAAETIDELGPQRDIFSFLVGQHPFQLTVILAGFGALAIFEKVPGFW